MGLCVLHPVDFQEEPGPSLYTNKGIGRKSQVLLSTHIKELAERARIVAQRLFVWIWLWKMRFLTQNKGAREFTVMAEAGMML